VIVNFPLSTLSHLGLGRARALSDDKPGARTAYQDFFALWKDADSDIPILKQTKRNTRSCSSWAPAFSLVRLREPFFEPLQTAERIVPRIGGLGDRMPFIGIDH
jgi:hypothetical protein